eukprot:scaffold82082_cov70-Cyclotella_meneghiniana.AAC.2
MNARAQGTIDQHLAFIKKAVENAEAINCTPFFKERGPFPLGDPVGMGLAVDLLLKSIFAEGRIGQFIQYDTMRKGRSTFTVTWSSSPAGIMDGACFNSTRSRIQFTHCLSESTWFKDFLLGAQDRMGYDTMNQKDLPILAVVAMIKQVEEDATASEDINEVNRLIKTAALITIFTAASLSSKGHEGKHDKIPDGALKKKLFTEEEAANLPEVCICLVGKFKVCEVEGGRTISAEYNALVRQYVGTMMESGDYDLDPNTTRRAGIPPKQVEAVNRRKKFERAQGKRPQFAMVDHYANARELSTLTWRYSYALQVRGPGQLPGELFSSLA